MKLLVVRVDAVADRDDGYLVSARDVDAAGRRGVREVMRMGVDREIRSFCSLMHSLINCPGSTWRKYGLTDGRVYDQID